MEENKLMALYDRSCPFCRSIIPQTQTPIWDAKGFLCPTCGQRLRTARSPLKLAWVIAVAVTMALCLFFGLRGVTAIVVSIVTSFPLSFVVHSVLGLFFSPPLEPFPENKIRDEDLKN
jgi:uncharacterized protein (DUF2062 family)